MGASYITHQGPEERRPTTGLLDPDQTAGVDPTHGPRSGREHLIKIAIPIFLRQISGGAKRL
jgi:hypothetical protein